MGHVSFTIKGILHFLRLGGGPDDTLSCPNEAAGEEGGPLYLANKDQKFASAQPVEIEYALVSTLLGLARSRGHIKLSETFYFQHPRKISNLAIT